MNILKRPLRAVIQLCFLQQLGCSAAAAAAACDDDGYAMYVWTSGFDPNAANCNGVYPINAAGDNATCFHHNWDTPAARSKLWSSCFNPGREITRLFLSDAKHRIENDGRDALGNCDPELMALLSEAHMSGVRVYALFADSQASFSESSMAAYPNRFNANCGTDDIYFDGVAVNNEYFATIKACDAITHENTVNVAAQQDHLDKLQLAVHNAAPLPLHFSVSWNWECCSCSANKTRNLEWPAGSGITKSALAHMVDISDSVDVQVAFITPDAMASRSTPAYQYWYSKRNKSSTSRVYTLAYTNPTDDCRTSFSPHREGSATSTDSCAFGTRTEAGMYQGFDYVESRLPSMGGGIHFMNGMYGSGITSGWPVHPSDNPTPSCPARPTSAPIPTSEGGPTTSPTTGRPSSGAPPTSAPTERPSSGAPTSAPTGRPPSAPPTPPPTAKATTSTPTTVNPTTRMPTSKPTTRGPTSKPKPTTRRPTSKPATRRPTSRP